MPTTSETYRQRYLDEVAPSGIAGRLIKFSKDGVYETTNNQAHPVPEGSEFVLLADDTLVGWIKFNGAGEAPDRRMGLLFDGFEMPPRESLGDLDPTQWEVGLDNQPADPWQHQQCLVLQDTKTVGAVDLQHIEQDGAPCRRQLAAALRTNASDTSR